MTLIAVVDRVATRLLPGFASAPLEKCAAGEFALVFQHLQLGECGGVEVLRGDLLLGERSFAHEDGKVTDRHERRLDELGWAVNQQRRAVVRQRPARSTGSELRPEGVTTSSPE